VALNFFLLSNLEGGTLSGKLQLHDKPNRELIGLAPVKYWEIIADNLSKAGWSLGWCRLWIQRDEQSGLWTGIATESVSSCVRMKY
jgi:hypothetical protein